MRVHLCAAAKDAADAGFLQGYFFAQFLEEFGGCEHAFHIVVGAQNGEGLVDDVGFVEFQFVERATLDQFVDPSGIEIDEKTNSPANLTQVFDSQTQAPRARRPQHQPIRPLGKCFFRKVVAEHFVVNLKIVLADPVFGHAGRATRFKDVRAFSLAPLGNPSAHGPAAQPFVLEMPEELQIAVSADFPTRIKAQAPRKVQPKWTTRVGIKMPCDHVAHMGIEDLVRCFDLVGDGCCENFHRCKALSVNQGSVESSPPNPKISDRWLVVSGQPRPSAPRQCLY